MVQAAPARNTVDAFRHDLRALEREVARQLEAETACCGVTLSQCHALLELKRGATSLSGLASALDLDLSTLSRTVDVLVRAGLVERSVDPTDRRAVCLVLTDAGRAKVATIDAGANDYYATLLAPLSERDRRQATRVVRALAEGMRKLRERGARPACGGSSTRRSAGNNRQTQRRK
jgi:DNA-binding MarR family transcriptional regulator